MIPTDEIVFIRAACRHTDRPAVIVRGLERTDGNRTHLAKELGVSRTTLNERIKRYGLT